MKTKYIRSRILEFFPKECILDIYKICMSKKIRDNNSKVDAIIACLNKYKIDYIELGPGTNRFAILIDGYVFKIALDKWGIQDNINELTVSEELQPFVSKTYECNDLILVAEYVTVISREEFAKKRHEIEKILAIISEGYLLGDVGIVPKNFCNWGYRDTGELVILDYAYIYRIIGDEMLCSVIVDQKTEERCGGMLEYDENFHDLRCPRCRTNYTFVDVRRRITAAHERHENELAKEMAYKVTEPLTLITVKEEDDSSLNINNSNTKEETTMPKEKLYVDYDEYDYDDDFGTAEKTDEECFFDALALMRGDKTEDDIIGDVVKDIKESNDDFDSFTDEIDNIKSFKEESITIQDQDGFFHKSTTEIETEDDDNFCITFSMANLTDEDLDDDTDESETEETPTEEVVVNIVSTPDEEVVINTVITPNQEVVEEITITTEPQGDTSEAGRQSPELRNNKEPRVVEIVEARVIESDNTESPQQLSLEIPDESDNTNDINDEDDVVDMKSFLISSSHTEETDANEEAINTVMADAFRELGLNIPENATIENVKINETTTTTMEVEYSQDNDIDALRSELAADLVDDDYAYSEYEDEMDITERIQKMKSSNREF